MRSIVPSILLLCSTLLADNLEKTQKKQLEAQVKSMTSEAQKLEKAGQLAEARIKYAESQALIEVKDVTDALKDGKGELVVRVWDPTDDGVQPRGKQAATSVDWSSICSILRWRRSRVGSRRVKRFLKG